MKQTIDDLRTQMKKIITEYNNPKSIISESIRTLRTNLEFSLATTNHNVIMITSSIPGEGKSFISSNLSISSISNVLGNFLSNLGNSIFSNIFLLTLRSINKNL